MTELTYAEMEGGYNTNRPPRLETVQRLHARLEVAEKAERGVALDRDRWRSRALAAEAELKSLRS